MGRLFRFILFALAFASATLTTNYAFAQTATPTSSPSPTNNAASVPTAAAGSRVIVGTVGAVAATGPAIAASTTVTDAPESVLLPTPTVAADAGIAANTTSPLTITSDTSSETDPLQGTILANRSESVARFFLEGQTYQLSAGRSQGIDLPRDTTVLNLFNCPGDLAVDTAGCFWDPYLIQQDGFYEIYDSANPGNQAKLMLREAGAPPTGQVWVQNRTGQTESLVFKEDVYQIDPTSVLEFPVAAGVPAILYVRSCLSIDNQSACEWAPKTLDAGVYYAMIEVDVPGTQSGSTLTNIDLRPVVGEEGEEPATAEVSTSEPAIICSVVVPALNVRSGPGLQYDIIGKVRTTDGTAVTVGVTGRSADNEWLTVDPSVADSGWINNSPSFITCSGDLVGLPIVDAPAVPTPQPSIVEASPPADTTLPQATEETAEVPPTTEEVATPAADAPPVADATPDAGPAIPDGQAVLVVNNGFQYEMRFTLDQMYRPLDGPSEFDLQPGDSINIVVFPGDVPFTASSPWSGLSSNATVHVDANQSLTLWLRFEPETGGSWVFAWN